MVNKLVCKYSYLYSLSKRTNKGFVPKHLTISVKSHIICYYWKPSAYLNSDFQQVKRACL